MRRKKIEEIDSQTKRFAAAALQKILAKLSATDPQEMIATDSF